MYFRFGSDRLNALIYMHNLKSPYIFVVDTTSYAGNFERELCAYVTGRIGECGVGDDMAERFTKGTGKKPFSNVIEEPDEHGCRRPVSIFPTPGWYNNGMGGHFVDHPSTYPAALKAHLEATRSYHAPHVKQVEAYLKTHETGTLDEKKALNKLRWTLAACKRELARYEAELKEAAECTKVSKYPAYLSVAISFLSKPSSEQIDLMKKRAKQFARLKERFGDGMRIDKITGFRLISQTSKQTEVAV